MHDTGGDTYAATAPSLSEGRRISFCGWKTGDVIANGLEIKELIGQGGMGVVWRVHHREWNRELAVKMPLPALVGSPTARDRFLREAETWIDLGVHPHIVQCWFVKDISGLPSLFLDYLTGGSLKQWLNAGHLKPGQWQRIIEIAIQVAEGLAYAHSRGVVHRDVKPANLLIRGDERVCVTDFGIVKTANDKSQADVSFNLEQLPQDVSITGTGAFLGTPQYGAPEQWGAAEGVDHAADIYALGVTIYEMCCGRRPFDSDEERTPPEVLIGRHLDAKPPDPREFFPGVPAELAHITLLCLEKDRRRRPHDMERLKGALAAIYERLFSRPYRGVGQVPKEQRADTLNNRGVSLHSLAKPREARDVWRRGLRIESGHAECLYNLTQLELRAGRIDGEEALRRLRQAKAGLALALMCIEEGHYSEAITTLQALDSRESGVSRGQIQRALGDAQMYAQQYYAAEKAYRSALSAMPADTLSHERKRLASLGRRGLLGKILFPSSESVFHVVLTDPAMRVICDDGSSAVVGISDSSAVYWNIAEQCVEHRVARPEGATAPVRLRTAGSLLLCEDRTSFELRRLPTLALLGRKSGEILAATPDLRKLVVRERKGVFIFNVAQSSLQKLEVEDVRLARFDLSGDLLCLLLSGGRIAQPEEGGRVVPEEWPATINRHETASCLALSSRGSHLYVGHSCGRLQSLDFGDRTVQFEMSFGQPVLEILTTPVSSKFVVRLQSGFVILERSGQILIQGSGAVALDHRSGRVLCFNGRRLELYSLTPFRRLRVWSEHEETAISLHLAADGQRAVSQSANGQFDVWEVDEDHRVFERGFLLSPGKSFADLTSASARFRESMEAAHEALSREQLATSYRHLQRARSVDGYAQRPEALDLNWQLLSALRRDRLESVWERASVESRGDTTTPGPLVLLGEGERLLSSFGSELQLYRDDGDQTSLVWSQVADAPILSIHVDELSLQQSALVVDQRGRGWKVNLESGERFDHFELEAGVLENAINDETGIIYRNARGEVGYFDVVRGKTLGRFSALADQRFDLFAWQPYQPLLVVESQFFKIDLRSPNPKPQIVRLKGVEASTRVTFAARNLEGSLLFLGFKDGTVVLCDPKGTQLFRLGAADGPITGFRLFPFLSVGVATTGKGKLAFWDLQSGKLLEEFSGHRGEISHFDASPTGRFLLTAGSDEQVRLWETSWTALEEEGEPPLPWMSSRRSTTRLGRFFGFRAR